MALPTQIAHAKHYASALKTLKHAKALHCTTASQKSLNPIASFLRKPHLLRLNNCAHNNSNTHLGSESDAHSA